VSAGQTAISLRIKTSKSQAKIAHYYFNSQEHGVMAAVARHVKP